MSETGVTLETTVEIRATWRLVDPGVKGAHDRLLGKACRDVDRLLADNEAKAREINRAIAERNVARHAREEAEIQCHRLRDEIARLKSRPTTEEGTAASPAEKPQEGGGPHRHSRKPDTTDTADQRPDIVMPASGPDAVARAQEICRPLFQAPHWLIQDVASALAAAEKRGAAEEREACAKLSLNPGFIQARDTEWDEGVNFAKRFIARAIYERARSQPDERGG